MAIHKLVFIPDPRLRMRCDEVQTFDKALQTLIDDMIETMYDAKGVGLAANQIGICKRLTVIDVSQDQNNPVVLINPEIIETKGTEKMQEGCLSVPGYYESVERAPWVKMRALDRKGKEYELEADGLLAEAIQHEIDHLNGIVFIDKLSRLKRSRITKKFEKAQRLSM